MMWVDSVVQLLDFDMLLKFQIQEIQKVISFAVLHSSESLWAEHRL